MHNIQSVLLGKKTLRGASPKLKKRKRLTLMEMILQIKSVSLVAKWGIFAGTVLPSRDNKPCQYRLKLTLQRHLAHEARRGIIGQKTVDLDSINGTTLTPQVQGSNFSQFQGNGQQGQPQPQTTIGAVTLNPFIPFVPSWNSSEQP